MEQMEQTMTYRVSYEMGSEAEGTDTVHRVNVQAKSAHDAIMQTRIATNWKAHHLDAVAVSGK